MQNVETMKKFWDENGYYLARGVFNSDEIAELEQDFDHIVKQITKEEDSNARWDGPEMEKLGASATQITHTHNVQRFSATWHHALLNPKFLEIATALLGPDVVLHHSKLFQKPPEKGAPFPMHQDWSYFPTENDSMLAGIIHVSDADDAMGCVRVYPGTHKLGRVNGTSGLESSELLSKFPLEGDGVAVCECKPGDVVFFHYFTLHGSKPNVSDRTRKTVLIQMYAGDDRVEEGNMHPDERLVLKGWNHGASRHDANMAK